MTRFLGYAAVALLAGVWLASPAAARSPKFDAASNTDALIIGATTLIEKKGVRKSRARHVIYWRLIDPQTKQALRDEDGGFIQFKVGDRDDDKIKLKGDKRLFTADRAPPGTYAAKRILLGRRVGTREKRNRIMLRDSRFELRLEAGQIVYLGEFVFGPPDGAEVNFLELRRDPSMIPALQAAAKGIKGEIELIEMGPGSFSLEAFGGGLKLEQR